MQDPNYAQITIPHLTAEIIDEDRSHYYLDWLEDVDRQRMYKAYLERKAAIEAKMMKEKDSARAHGEGPLKQKYFDTATMQRR